MTTTSERYEPTSLRAIVDAGLDPVEHLKAIGRLPNPTADRVERTFGASEHDDAMTLAENVGLFAPNSDPAQVRAELDWMVDNRTTGMGDPANPENTAAGNPGGFLNVTTAWLWRAEVIEDPSLVERAIEAGGEVARRAWAEFRHIMDRPERRRCRTRR